MIPNQIDHILKPKSSQLMIRSREESEENLEYVSHKKLEKLKQAYQSSLEKSKPPGSKSLSHHNEEKSVTSSKNVTKKRSIFRGIGGPVENNTQSKPFQTTYENAYNSGPPTNRQNLDLKAKIQQKLQNSNEILQKKLAFVTPRDTKKKSLPSLSNIFNSQGKNSEQDVKRVQISARDTFSRNLPPNQEKTQEEDLKVTEDNLQTEFEGDGQASMNPQPECFLPDWGSVSESHWQDLLNSDVFKNYNINPFTLIENNPDYFSHLLGLCACIRCKCGLCKCKYAESKNASLRLMPNYSQTVYQREYFDKTGEFRMHPGLSSSSMYPLTVDGSKPLGLAYTTTHQAEYRPYTVTPQQRKLRNHSENKNPFLSLSTYNSNFVDWRNYNPMKVKMPQHITTIKELPFFDRTTYKDNFMATKPDQSNTEFVKNIHATRTKMGIFNQMPFLGETQHNMNFRPYKVGKPLEGAKSSLYKTPCNLEILNESPQEGHYMSMTTHDFKGVQDFICPAKQKIDLESLKSQIYSKLENINSVHQKSKTDGRSDIGSKKGKS